MSTKFSKKEWPALLKYFKEQRFWSRSRERHTVLPANLTTDIKNDTKTSHTERYAFDTVGFTDTKWFTDLIDGPLALSSALATNNWLVNLQYDWSVMLRRLTRSTKLPLALISIIYSCYFTEPKGNLGTLDKDDLCFIFYPGQSDCELGFDPYQWACGLVVGRDEFTTTVVSDQSIVNDQAKDTNSGTITLLNELDLVEFQERQRQEAKAKDASRTAKTSWSATKTTFSGSDIKTDVKPNVKPNGNAGLKIVNVDIVPNKAIKDSTAEDLATVHLKLQNKKQLQYANVLYAVTVAKDAVIARPSSMAVYDHFAFWWLGTFSQLVLDHKPRYWSLQWSSAFTLKFRQWLQESPCVDLDNKKCQHMTRRMWRLDTLLDTMRPGLQNQQKDKSKKTILDRSILDSPKFEMSLWLYLRDNY